MRFVEFNSGLKTYISGEEYDLLEQIAEKGIVSKKDLKEREQELAKGLTIRSILIRQKVKDDIQFKISNSANYTTAY